VPITCRISSYKFHTILSTSPPTNSGINAVCWCVQPWHSCRIMNCL
jgi:hypothetical protein